VPSEKNPVRGTRFPMKDIHPFLEALSMIAKTAFSSSHFLSRPKGKIKPYHMVENEAGFEAQRDALERRMQTGIT